MTFDKGAKNKSIDSSSMRVYSIEFDELKPFKIKWLTYEVDLDLKESSQSATKLYRSFIKCYKEQTKLEV